MAPGIPERVSRMLGGTSLLDYSMCADVSHFLLPSPILSFTHPFVHSFIFIGQLLFACEVTDQGYEGETGWLSS